MKVKAIALVTFVSVVSAGSAMAYDRTTTFTSKVVAQTYTVSTSDEDLAVTLPTVTTSSPKGNATTSGLTPFAIRLTDCATDTNSAQNVKVYFGPSSNIDLATHNLENTAIPTKADNVQIRLLDSNGASTVFLGEADGGQDVQSGTIRSDGSATLRYMTQCYTTRQSTTEDVKAAVHYTIAYE